jgi:hypothetical protein
LGHLKILKKEHSRKRKIKFKVPDAKTAVTSLDKKDQVLREWRGKAVIKSERKLRGRDWIW